MSAALGLDPVIHPPKRLMIMSIICRTAAVDFRFLRDELDLRDADLSKQMRTLTEAGYVKTSKQGRGPKSSTWYRPTAAGKKAFASHTAALRAVISLGDEAENTVDTTPA